MWTFQVSCHTVCCMSTVYTLYVLHLNLVVRICVCVCVHGSFRLSYIIFHLSLSLLLSLSPAMYICISLQVVCHLSTRP